MAVAPQGMSGAHLFTNELAARAAEPWEACFRLPFVQELGTGELSRETFRFYLVQDELYLAQYARALAVAGQRSAKPAFARRCEAAQAGILAGEGGVHARYLAEQGLSRADIPTAEPALFCRAYAAHILAAAHEGTPAHALAALLPCAWMYADFACRLQANPSAARARHYYAPLLATYADPAFLSSYAWMFDELNALAAAAPSLRPDLRRLFAQSVHFEALFFHLSYRGRQTFAQ